MRKHRLLGSVATLAIAVGGLAALPASADAATPSTTHADAVTVKTNVSSDGWVVNSQNSPSGTITNSTAPDGRDAARFTTQGDGNIMTLFGTQYAIPNQLKFADMTGLSYDTYVQNSEQAILAPSIGMEVWGGDSGGFLGTMVYEPYVADPAQPVTDGQWQSWNAMDPNALWWSTKDTLNPDNTVLYPAQSAHTLAEFEAAWAKYPAKYSNLHTENGIKTYVGSSQPQAGWDNFIGYVDDVRVTTNTDDTIWDFASSGLGDCNVGIDEATQTYTLNADCSTFDTLNVDNGWTVDGAGHTITAVEDSGHPNFPGPVMLSATGDDSGPATMNVENLKITTQFSGANSGGGLAGIKFMNAGGDVDNVTINGITHGDGVQEGNALYIRNRDSQGGSQVPLATVTVEGVTVTDYQKTGVIFDGNVHFTMTDSAIGSATDVDGNPLTSIGANAVQISRAAHGSITDSTIGLNQYIPTEPPGDGSDATGILVYNAKTVDLERNVIAGANGDVGLDAENDTYGVIDTTVNASCNLFQRNETSGYDPYGVGVAQYAADAFPGSSPVDVSLSDNTFNGWNFDTGTLDGTPPNLTVGPGATNEHLNACPASAPTDVVATGGDRQTDVSWTAAAPAGPYAPVSGYQVTVTGTDGSSQQISVGADTTTVHIDGLARGVDYTISVVALSGGGNSQPATITLHSTALDLQAAKSRIPYGASTTLSGTLSSSDPNADLAGRTVVIQRRAVGVPGAQWRHQADVTTAADGTFSTTVEPKVKVVYRAVYKGDPDMSSNSAKVRVNVAPKVAVVVSDRTVDLGTTVLFVARVTPNSTGQPVYLQQLESGIWTNIRQGTLGSHGAADFRWRAHPVGVSTFRVFMPPTATRASGISHRITITVS